MLVGIDPGKTTGVCFIEPPYEILCVGQVSNTQTLVASLRTIRPDVVVLEEFRLYPGKAVAQSLSRMYSSEVIGAVVSVCFDLGIDVVRQPASARKMVSNRVLEVIGGLRATRGLPHARDALRHALYYCQQKHPKDFASLLK